MAHTFRNSSARTLFLVLAGLFVIAPLAQTRQVDQGDGRQWKILFDSGREGNPGIYVMNPDGSNPRFGVSENPAWSPDGTRIAFDRNGDIYVMDPDGSNLRRLTRESSHPMWSPDGKRIGFMSRRDGNMEVYVMDADGAHVRKLTNTPVGRSVAPDWSPDGRKIVFVSERDGNMEIYVMNVDGTNLRNLTRNRARDSHPAW